MAISNPAAAATLNYTNNVLMGASGVDVGGTLYDVTFGDEKLTASSITAFTDQVSADKASQSLGALLATLTRSGDINGITFSTGSIRKFNVVTAYSEQTNGNINLLKVTFHRYYGTGVESGVGTNGFDYSTNTGETLAKWTKSQSAATAVPEPEAYAMMLAGLGLVGFAARRKQKTA